MKAGDLIVTFEKGYFPLPEHGWAGTVPDALRMLANYLEDETVPEARPVDPGADKWQTFLEVTEQGRRFVGSVEVQALTEDSDGKQNWVKREVIK